MFGFRKNRVHEPVDLQHAENRKYDPVVTDRLFAGEDCDVVTGASGPFGRCATNPIPVNGLYGSFKYLGKLSAPSGSCFFFHKVCTVDNPLSDSLLNVYELVSIDGSLWDCLFLDVYHPRRSNNCPQGLVLHPYIKEVGDHPYTYGVNVFVENFPYDLPTHLRKLNPITTFADRAAEHLRQKQYTRPAHHLTSMDGILVKPTHTVIHDPTSGARFYVGPK